MGKKIPKVCGKTCVHRKTLPSKHIFVWMIVGLQVKDIAQRVILYAIKFP